MAMFSKGRGLFGAPMMGETPPYAPGASPVQVDSTVPMYKKPSTGRLILGTLGDTLSQWGGGQGTFLPGLQMRQQQAEQAAMYQRKRADEQTDWLARQEYQRTHPAAQAEDAFTVDLRHAGIDPSSPEGVAKYREKVAKTLLPPPVWVSDGAGGGRLVYPGGNPSTPTPQAPVGKLTPLGGGGASPGTRSFPIR